MVQAGIRTHDLMTMTRVRCYTSKLQARMNEHTHNIYEYIVTQPFISNQRLSDKIWLSSIGTKYENIIFGIFSRKIIF